MVVVSASGANSVANCPTFGAGCGILGRQVVGGGAMVGDVGVAWGRGTSHERCKEYANLPNSALIC
jgi:hypothetical protein